MSCNRTLACITSAYDTWRLIRCLLCNSALHAMSACTSCFLLNAACLCSPFALSCLWCIAGWHVDVEPGVQSCVIPDPSAMSTFYATSRCAPCLTSPVAFGSISACAADPAQPPALWHCAECQTNCYHVKGCFLTQSACLFCMS